MTYRKAAVIIVSATTLSACQFIPDTNAFKERQAEKTLADRMIDPSSAEFRSVKTSKDGSRVCGEINAKNRMGAFVGYTQFVELSTIGIGYINNDTTQRDVDDAYCPDAGTCPNRDEKVAQLVERQMFEAEWKKYCG